MTLQVRASSRTTHTSNAPYLNLFVHGENTQSTNQSLSNRPLNPCTSTTPPTRNTTNNIRRVPRAHPFCHYRSRPHKTQTKHPKPRDPLHVGHSVVHASDACGSRERPTGRALPQAEQLETPQQLGKDADVAPAAPEVRERGPRATECVPPPGVASRPRGAAPKCIVHRLAHKTVLCARAARNRRRSGLWPE